MTAPRPPGRLLGLLVLLLVVAAAVLWGSSRLTWVSQVVESATGPRTSTADGAGAEPILVPWALLCLAAVGGLVATAGWGRRVVGTLVAVAGLWAVLRAATGLVAPTLQALSVGVRPGDRPLPPEAVASGPLLAVLGGLLMLAAGLLTVRWAAVLPRMGARYDAPGERRPAPADPDRALWEALDEGSDPTAGPEPGPGPHRDPDPRADTDGGRGDDRVRDLHGEPPPGRRPGGPLDSGGGRARESGLTWNELGRGKGADPA
ncbi:hypothetical protein GCM10023200_18100 [Actinomycetospora chlora]|uniref:Uncharacterized protein n=1 Tax=Actinomycetospora chlora TaxID=663608 RepID=A0ABP9ARM3_9PSEU